MISTTVHAEAVAATITPAGAAGVPWQAVVVGAGPAGAAAAWRLAVRGIRVLLVDRHGFPRGKVCGCCLSARALRELANLDAFALPESAVPLAAVRLAHRGRCVRIPLPAGRVVSREALDAWLVRRAITAGCQWLPGARVAAIDDHDDGGSPVTVGLADGCDAAGGTQAISAEVVILATGLADHVRIAGRGVNNQANDHTDGRRIDPRSRIGVGGVLPATASSLPEGELVMAVGRGGYCGIVRLEDGRIDVAAAIDRAMLARDADPARAVARLLDEAADSVACHLPDADTLRTTSFRATPPLTRRASLVAGTSRRILRVGDAAGYVEPFTGEGIGWALASGRILAESLFATHGLRPAAVAAARYCPAYKREFAAVHSRCRLVALGLRQPIVVAATVAAADALPWAAQRIVPAVIGAGPPGGFA